MKLPDAYTVCGNVDVRKRWVLVDYDDDSIACANIFDSKEAAQDNAVAELNGVMPVCFTELTTVGKASIPRSYLLRIDGLLLAKQINHLGWQARAAAGVAERHTTSHASPEDVDALNGVIKLLDEILQQHQEVYRKPVS